MVFVREHLQYTWSQFEHRKTINLKLNSNRRNFDFLVKKGKHSYLFKKTVLIMSKIIILVERK